LGIKKEEMKTCPTCKEYKSLEDYWKGQYSCIPCTKEKQKNRWASRSPKKRLHQHLKYKYGVTEEKLMETLDKQENACAICREALPDLLVYENRRRGYAIDHNHNSGEFRGVLCTNCNTLLGMAKDNKDILFAAINYLEANGTYAAVAKKKK
jgi:hypothetical protein